MTNKIKTYRKLFHGRKDVVPRYWKSKTGKSGYSPLCRNEWQEEICKKPCSTCPNGDYIPLSDSLIQDHFKGKIILGMYPLFEDNTCWFVAADFDNHTGDRNPVDDVKAFHEACQVQDVPCYVLRSKSGVGYHAYVFFKEPVPAWKARIVTFALLQEAEVIGENVEISSFDRLFPSQDEHSGKGFGNLIALPFQGIAAKKGHTLFLDPETDFTEPYTDQWEVLRSVQKVSEFDLDALIEEWDLKKGSNYNKDQSSFQNNPSLDPAKILSGVPEGERDTTLYKYACRLRGKNLSLEEAKRLVLEAAQNCTPPFSESEALKKIESAWKYKPGTMEEDPKFTRKELADRIEATDDFDELTGPIAKDVTESGLPKTSILSLRKFIAKKAKVSVASLEADAKEADRHVKANKDFNHLEAAQTVVQSFGAENIIHALSFNWKWNNRGVWEKMDDREIKVKIHKIAGSDELTRSIVDSVLDLTKTEIFRPNHQFDINKNTINCLNGELRWAEGKWILEPHKRENYRTTQIPVTYDPKAEAPRFVQFLGEVFRDDPDKNEKSIIISEVLGYSLLSSCRYEKFILLIGPGANGKSVLMDTLASFVGSKNVSGVQPSQFENRFQRAHLHCKLVNLVTEIAQGHEIADAQLKAIVSGELTTAEHKHKPPFDFTPYATCWFGTNHMPHTRDFSDALFRRAIIIPFNRTFTEDEQDKHLKSKLKAELPGILNLALEGLACVFERGDFTHSKSSEDAKKEWRIECDQVAQFAEDRCVFGIGLSVTSAELYKAYKTWTYMAGIKRTLNRKNFTSRMVRLGAKQTRGTKGIRKLAGVALKNF